MGVSEDSQRLTYPAAALLETGAAALGGLGSLLLSGPVQGRGLELLSLPLAAVALGGAIWWGRRRGGRARALWLAGLLPMCLVGVIWLQVAVRMQHVVLYSSMVQRTSCRTHDPGQQVEPLPRQIAAEVCSWLYNNTPEDLGRLKALVGGFCWAGLALLLLGLLAAGTRGLGPLLRALCGAAAGIYLLLAVWLLAQTPRAYALVRYGLRYPVVSQVDASCGAGLSRALAQGRCQAWDLSAGAEQRLLFLRGACGQDRDKDVLLLEPRCLGPGALDNVDVIDHGGRS